MTDLTPEQKIDEIFRTLDEQIETSEGQDIDSFCYTEHDTKWAKQQLLTLIKDIDRQARIDELATLHKELPKITYTGELGAEPITYAEIDQLNEMILDRLSSIIRKGEK